MTVEPSNLSRPFATDSRSEFRRIVDEHAAYLWRALRHLGVRDRDLEDVCQEVFLVAHRRLEDFRGESSMRTWLYGIAVRLASEHRRRAHVRREVPSAELPQLEIAATAQIQVESNELLELLRGILEQLDDDKRAVFVLYEIEELDMKEVASALGCPLQTAYSRLHAARKFVAKAVSDRDAPRARKRAPEGTHGT